MNNPSRFEQFVRFSNDSVGLERLLRLFQSLVQIIISYPLILTLISPFITSHPTASSELTLSATLSLLRGRVALARRFLRVFRFLDNFLIAQRLFSERNLSTATYFTALSRTFNGLYLLLESSTLPDAFGIEGLLSPVTAVATALGWEVGADEKSGGIFDPVWRANIEAQRFWFLSLVCAVAAGVVKVYGMRGSTAMEKKKVAQDEKTAAKRSEKSTAVVKQTADTSREYFVTVRKLVADFLDLALPGSIVGWVPLEAGPVSIVMLITTILTGWEVWERIGKEMVRGSS